MNLVSSKEVRHDDTKQVMKLDAASHEIGCRPHKVNWVAEIRLTVMLGPFCETFRLHSSSIKNSEDGLPILGIYFSLLIRDFNPHANIRIPCTEKTKR